MSLDSLENNIESMQQLAELSDTHPEAQTALCDPKKGCYHSLNSIVDTEVEAIDVDCLADAYAEARALIWYSSDNTYVSTLIMLNNGSFANSYHDLDDIVTQPEMDTHAATLAQRYDTPESTYVIEEVIDVECLADAYAQARALIYVSTLFMLDKGSFASSYDDLDDIVTQPDKEADEEPMALLDKAECVPQVEEEPIALLDKAACVPEAEEEPTALLDKVECVAQTDEEPVALVDKAECAAQAEEEPIDLVDKAECLAQVEEEPIATVDKAECVAQAEDEPIALVDGEVEVTKDTKEEASQRIVLLSREERQLDGAPETDLFQVVVLPSNEIEPADDPLRELTTIENSYHKLDQLELWAAVFDAITSLRRLFLHHPEVVLERVMDFVPLIQHGATNLRSAMARNALLCINNLFSMDQLEASAPLFDIFIPILLGRQEKKFLSQISSKAMTHVVTRYPCRALLAALYGLAKHKDPLVKQSVAIYAEKCITPLYDGKTMAQDADVEYDLKHLVPLSSSCKSANGRKATKRSLGVIYTHKGNDAFVACLNKVGLSNSLQSEIIQTVCEPKTQSSLHHGLSLKERMQLAKCG